MEPSDLGSKSKHAKKQSKIKSNKIEEIVPDYKPGNRKKRRKEKEIIWQNTRDNQLIQCKSELDTYTFDMIESLYVSTDLFELNQYTHLSFDEKKELVTESHNNWIKINHSNQLNQCLDDFGLDKSIYDELNYHQYDISNDSLYKLYQCKTSTKNNFLWDIFYHIDTSFDKLGNQSHLEPYSLLSESDKNRIITVEYYMDQQKKILIQTSKFSSDHFVCILGLVRFDSQKLFNMALVSKSFYEIVGKVDVDIKQGQVCPNCGICIFRRSIQILCVTCREIKRKQSDCLKYITKLTPIMPIIECYTWIAQTFGSKDLIGLAGVDKYIYNIVKTIIASIPKGMKIECGQCPNYICISERSMISCHNKCGSCLNQLVWGSGNVPAKKWTSCRLCKCEFFIKNNYIGRFPKCLYCRSRI